MTTMPELVVNSGRVQDSVQVGSTDDLWPVTLIAGVTYEFRLTQCEGSAWDPYLILYSASNTMAGRVGDVVASDDNSGGDRNSLVVYTPTSSGSYFVAVDPLFHQSSGPYYLEVTADYSNPYVTSFQPAVLPTDNIVITFSEPIQFGTGSITLNNGYMYSTIETFDVANSDRLSISGSTMTIHPTSALNYHGNYYVIIPSGTIKDLSDNANVITSRYSFTTPSDTFAPTVSSFNPTDGATGVSVTGNIVITFNEAIQRGTGSIVLTNAAGTTIETFDAASSNRLSISGSALTIDPTNPLASGTKYYVTLASGTIKDLVGNAYAGTNTYDFTTTLIDTISPYVSSFSPADGATGISATANIVVTFSEAIQRGPGSIVLKNAAGTTIETFDAATSDRLSISDSTLTIDPTNTLANGTNYYITFASGTIKDLSGNAYAGTNTYDFTTWADTIAPTVSSFSPADGATGISATSNIVATFSEAIQRGTGSIVLKNAAGTTIETFDAASSDRLSISGSTLTIDPVSILANGVNYYVTFASGTIKDMAENLCAATTTYDFTTAADTTAPTVYYLGSSTGATAPPAIVPILNAITATALTGIDFNYSFTNSSGYGDPYFSDKSESIYFNSNGQVNGRDEDYCSGIGTTPSSYNLNNYSGTWSIEEITRLSDTAWTAKVCIQLTVGERFEYFTISDGSASWDRISSLLSSGQHFYLTDVNPFISSRTQDAAGSGNDVLDSSASAITMGPSLLGLDGDDILTGNNSRADYLFGGSGNDTISGLGGDDFLYGDALADYGQVGDDVIEGGADTDVAFYFYAVNNYTVTHVVSDHYVISGPEGTDQLYGIEFLQFGDTAPVLIDALFPHANNDPTVGVSTSADIVLYFSEAIQGGSGNIVLTNAVGTTIEIFNVASSSRLLISGSTLTIDPTNTLASGSDYYVTLGNGTIRDLAGNTCAAGTYDFTIEAVTVSTGTAGNDMIHCGVANEIMDGGVGIDTAIFSCNHSDCTITKTADGFTLSGGGNGTDTLSNIERLQFADCHLALDLDGNAGSTAKILGAVFGPASVANKTYAGIGIGLIDGGMSYEALAALAINAAGASTPQQVVNLLWTNVVGSAPSAGQAQPFVDMLNGSMTIGQLGVLAADTGMNQTNINMLGLLQTGLEYV